MSESTSSCVSPRWDQLCMGLTDGLAPRVPLVRAPARQRPVDVPHQHTRDIWAQPLPYRCAEHCDYGRGQNGRCMHPEVRTTVDAARARGGACGPEASHMTVKGRLL